MNNTHFDWKYAPPQWKSLRAVRALFCLLIITACLAGAASAAVTADTSWHDDGSASTFTLNDAADLFGFAQLVKNGNSFSEKTVMLGGNINLNDEEWTPIMQSQSGFAGTFDGAGYTISGLSITGNRDATSYLGLFGVISSGTVKNLNVDGKIDVVSSSGNVYAGALVGQNDGGKIENCSSSVIVNVTGSNEVYVGGLVGYSQSSASVTNCSVTGDVNAVKTGNQNSAFVGGLVGWADSSSISQCYAVCDVTASSEYSRYQCVGGLAGQLRYSPSSITNSFFAGNVTAGKLGQEYVGGLVGNLASSAQISKSYVVGTVSDGQYAGGLAGYAGSDSISNSYALNKQVDGTTEGRIVGDFSGSLSENSAWENMAGGASGNAANQNGAPISSEAVWNNAETFSGWDSNIWKMNTDDTYKLPVLKALAKPAYDASYLDPDAGKVQVTYNANGGTGAVPTDETKYTVGTEVTVLGSGELTHASKYFVGWNTQADGIGTTYIAGDKFTISTDTTLYAMWSDTAEIYKVTYDANGATSGAVPTEKQYNPGNNEVTIEYGADLTKTGYYFNGWNTQADGKGANYGGPNEGMTFTISKDTTLYAKWAPIVYYIDFHNGTETDRRQCTYDTETTFPWQSTIPGQTLIGWAEVEGGAVKYPVNPDCSVTLKNLTSVQGGTVNLYAVWKGETYTVTFVANGGEGTMETASGLEYGKEYTLPECGFTWTGYELIYWSISSVGVSSTYGYPGDKYTITNDVTLTAQWTEAQVTITFDTQGGTEISPISGKYTEEITIPDDPTKTGYIFEKWNPQLINVLPAEDTTYVAQWKPITYTVFYNENNGDGVKTSQVFEYNVSKVLTVDPDSITAPSGKEFNGWNTEADGSGDSYPADYSASKMTTENGYEITLYAQWKDIVSDDDDSDYDYDYDYDDYEPSTPSTPTTPTTPTTPEVPVTPEVPDVPETPDTPEEPEQPTDEPETPTETPAPILGMVLGGLAAAVVLRRK